MPLLSANIVQFSDELQRMQPLKKQHNESNERLRSLNTTLGMVRETLKNSSFQILQEEIADLEKVGPNFLNSRVKLLREWTLSGCGRVQ